MNFGDTSIFYALLLVVLIAIPQASQTVTDDIEFEEFGEIRNVENSTEDPVNIVSERDSSGYNQTVTTADEKTVTRVTSNKSVTAIEKPDMQIEVVETPSFEKVELETSDGLLIDHEGSSKDLVEVHGPEGTLIEKTVNGSEKIEFDGLKVEALEERKQILEDKLEENLEQVDFDTETSTADPGFELSVQPDNSEGNGEFIEIFNTRDDLVDISGWTIEDSVGVSYEFSSNAEIESNDGIRVYTNHSEAEHNWDYWRPIWSQDGDTAYLYNDEDDLVAEESYN